MYCYFPDTFIKLVKYHLAAVCRNLTSSLSDFTFNALSTRLLRLAFIAAAMLHETSIDFLHKTVCPSEVPVQILCLGYVCIWYRKWRNFKEGMSDLAFA